MYPLVHFLPLRQKMFVLKAGSDQEHDYFSSCLHENYNMCVKFFDCLVLLDIWTTEFQIKECKYLEAS